MLPFHSLLLQVAAANCGKPTFFGLVPWYQYLQVGADSNGQCTVQNITVLDPNHASSFLLIGMAVIDDLLRVAALVAFFFIIVGGFNYMTSQGAPDAVGKAKSTIMNALIGLVIAIMATAIVNYIGNSLGAS